MSLSAAGEAGAGTVFSLGVAVGFKLRPAGRANEMVDCLALHSFGMLCPPSHATLVRAESLPFCVWSVHKQPAAISANFIDLCRLMILYITRAKPVAPAIGLYCVF